MFKWLSKFVTQWRLARLRRMIGAEIERRQIPVVQIEVVPSQLTLKSFNPDKKQEAWACNPDGSKRDRLEFYLSTWDGTTHFPFWGSKLQISLFARAPRPSSRQLDHVRQIFDYPTNIRGEIEAAIFNHYETDVFCDGALDIDDRPLPKLRNVKQIRKLLRGPTIHPNHDDDDHESDVVEFKLHFGCDWDEHGLDVCINDWRVKGLK